MNTPFPQATDLAPVATEATWVHVVPSVDLKISEAEIMSIAVGLATNAPGLTPEGALKTTELFFLIVAAVEGPKV
jgi:hypothetical protein